MNGPPNVRVHLATIEDKSAIASMMESYLHDMASFTAAKPDVAGRYSYRFLDDYWTTEGVAEGRIPYLIIADETISGFAFINRYSRLGSADTYNVAEFYVKDSRRGNGVGKKAVEQIIAMHPGGWEIAVLRANTPALAFWTSVFKKLARGQFEITATDPAIWDGTVITLEHK
jgi:predicted acetyltransferase